MSETKKTILLTNDDGFHAPGIKHLYDALYPHYNVVVAAPKVEQSGVSHTFTFRSPLTYREADPSEYGMPGYIIDGSPADCVKFAISAILKASPDIVVSGMNNGDNSGVAAFYSGTVSAAREGAFYGIPSFAFSMYNRTSPYAAQYAAMAPTLINEIMNTPHPPLDTRVFYSVNFPPCDPAKSKGFKVTWQSMANYEDEYKKMDDGRYQVFGDRYKIEESTSFDARAVLSDYISITPLNIDSTAHWMIPYLRQRIEDGLDVL